MSRRKRWLLTAIASYIAIFITSCPNLTAVREWSKTSLEATQYNEIVTTYANTPQRLKRYDPSKPWDDQIKLRKNQAKALRQILSVVSGYMAALATLSADSTVDYNKDVDALSTGLSKLNENLPKDKKISKDALGAVGSLMKAILGAAASAYQAKQVASIVEQANEPLQVILRGELRNIVAEDFLDDLETEKIWIDRYYDRQLQAGCPSDAARVALEEWKELRLEQNDKKVKAVNAYLEVLDKVAEGHQKLHDNRNKLDAKTLTKDLFLLVTDIRKQIRILDEA